MLIDKLPGGPFSTHVQLLSSTLPVVVISCLLSVLVVVALPLAVPTQFPTPGLALEGCITSLVLFLKAQDSMPDIGSAKVTLLLAIKLAWWCSRQLV